MSNTNIEKLPYSIFTNIQIDIKNHNYLNIFYDVIGIIGSLIIIFSYIPQIYHISKTKKLTGVPRIYFYIRYIGIMMLFIYAYLRKEYSKETVISLFFVLTILYYFYIRIFT